MENAVSVRSLVEFALPPSDLILGGVSGSRLVEGSRIHRQYQAQAGEDYQSEVFFSYRFEGEETLIISGRADGLVETGSVTEIEELKSTLSLPAEIKPSPQHIAQLHCYGAMYCLAHGVSSVILRLIYIHVDSAERKEFSQELDASRLMDEFFGFCRAYAHALFSRRQSLQKRNKALDLLSFPFPAFRPGQREMSAAVYRSIRDQKHLMIEAPTGIGKTLAALFPALKALGQGYGERIFYLSARGTIQSLAGEAVRKALPEGLPFLSVVLTAREKCCPTPGCGCYPLECSLAAGFYVRLPAALEEARDKGFCSAETVLHLSQKHRLCPFELSLAIAEQADFIICDYNYVFDPKAHLRRFFDEKGDHILLIDEAHNLADRARDCYSASLSWEDVMLLRRALPKGKQRGALGTLKRAVCDLQAWFVSLRKRLQDSSSPFVPFQAPPQDLAQSLQHFMAASEAFLDDRLSFSPQLYALYFSVRNYCSVSNGFDSCFRVLARVSGSDVSLRLYCLDPARKLQKSYDQCRAAVFFSATLSPISHFQRILGLEQAAHLSLPSFFPKEHLKVLLSPSLSTAYRHREETMDALCAQLAAYYSAHPGRYAVFFPSHAYLQMACARFHELYPDIEAPCQEPNMDTEQRQAFLARFEQDQPMLAFAVMGGLFGEGVDLAGERLQGAVIIGVGLPQPDEEREALRAYFQENGEDGFAHAYLYPGFIRVLQAAGRVIRTPQDRGTVLLMDPRFTHSRYTRLFPESWKPVVKIADDEQLTAALKDFWSDSVNH